MNLLNSISNFIFSIGTVDHMITRQSLHRTAIQLTRIIGFAALFQLSTACSLPNSKLTTISVSGRLVSKTGQPVSNQPIEVTLPASYGLSEIDAEYSSPESLGRETRRAIVRTDSMGSFTHSFTEVPYSTALWILPPLGNFPKTPPQPQFLMRVMDNPDAVYSMAVNKEDITYAVWRGSRNKHAYPKPPYAIKGRLLEDERNGSDSWIADLILRSNYR
jgi:hypothetical protein